jgi:tetratricopeptide (TPR) repeat protein
LRKAGLPLQIISESDFYRLSGHQNAELAVVGRLTIADLAKTLKMPAAILRQWIRWGLLQPSEVIHRLEFFNFTAVSTARRLLEWTKGDFTIAQVRRELDRIRKLLPGQLLSDANLIRQHGRLLIRHRDALLDGSGQRYFDFSEEKVPSLEILPEPADLGDLFEKALLAESKGRWQDAVELYQEAIQLRPENPVLYFNLGNNFYALGRLEKSRDSFHSALKFDDSYAEAWNNLGNVYLELEQWKEAIEAFSEALKLVSHYQDAKQNLDLALALLADRRRTKIYQTPS